MPGPLPKDPKLRQRRNKTATRATLTVITEARKRMPSLPRRPEGDEWQPLTKAWWRDVWHSPMAAEYLEADIHALYRLAVLVDKFWTEPAVNTELAIQRAQQCFGLTPIDRRRLQWEIVKTEDAMHKQSRREPTRASDDDPRKVLQAV